MAEFCHVWNHHSDAEWQQYSDDTDLFDYAWSLDHYAADEITDSLSTYTMGSPTISSSITPSETASPVAGSMNNDCRSSLDLIRPDVRFTRSISPIHNFRNMSTSSDFCSSSGLEESFRISFTDVTPKIHEACASKETRMHQSHYERRREQNRVAQRRFRARKEAKLNSSVDASRKLQNHVLQLQKQIIDLETANLKLQQLIGLPREIQ